MTVRPPSILSIQVGLPMTIPGHGGPGPRGRPWTTAIFKEPVAGPIRVGFTGLAGDGQADLRVHGGRNKAVLAYAGEHFAGWREELGIPDIGPGGFGENLTLVGLNEQSVCIGDVHAIGGAVLQVSQPRGPCWKLARRWDRPDLPARVQKSARNGWYYRVLSEGVVKPGDRIELLHRPLPQWALHRVIRER